MIDLNIGFVVSRTSEEFPYVEDSSLLSSLSRKIAVFDDKSQMQFYRTSFSERVMNKLNRFVYKAVEAHYLVKTFDFEYLNNL